MKTYKNNERHRKIACEVLHSLRYFFTNDEDYECKTFRAYYMKATLLYQMGIISKDCYHRAYHMNKIVEERISKTTKRE